MNLQETLTTLITYAAVSTPLVSGIVAGIKTTFKNFNARYYPIVSVTVGMIVSFCIGLLAQGTPQELKLAIGAGFISGLMACGLFQYGKERQAKKEEEARYG